MSAASRPGAIAIIEHNPSGRILLGKDGQYLFEQKGFKNIEISPAEPFDPSDRDERVRVTARLAEAIIEATGKSEILVPLVEHRTPGMASKARVPKPGQQFSAPKGGEEKVDNGDLKATVLRELYEEVGDFDFSNIQDTGRTARSNDNRQYRVFYLGIDDSQREELERAIGHRQSAKIGEMFDLQFYNMGVLRRSQVNTMTLNALSVVPREWRVVGTAAAGGRHRRHTRRCFCRSRRNRRNRHKSRKSYRYN